LRLKTKVEVVRHEDRVNISDSSGLLQAF